jgi:HK97 family phage portal protein
MKNPLKTLVQFVRPKAATTLQEPEWWRQTIGMPPTISGEVVTPETAMTNSAIYACVRILSETIASLPLKVYKKGPNGSRMVLPDHPLNTILGQSPNDTNTACELREYLVANLALRGNAYAEILSDGAGGIGGLYPLNSRYMNVDTTERGKLVFDYHEPGRSRVYTPSQLWRTVGLSGDGVTGVSPIQLAREGIGLTMAMENYASSMFSHGATPPGVLEFPGKLQNTQVDSLRSQFADAAGKRRPLILESGMSYKSVGMSAEDAQFIESRKFQVAEVARWYRVPLHMLAELDRSTFSNIEHQSIEFVVHTIRPWLVRLEQSIWRDLLDRKEQRKLFVSHAVEGLLRGDTKARYEAYTRGIQDGWLSRNEVRALENMNPADGLDQFVLPMNFSTLSEREAALEETVANGLEEKERKTLETEASRKTPDEFVKWVPDYYDRFTGTIAKTLGVSLEKAKRYTEARKAAIIADPVAGVIRLMEDRGELLKAVKHE